MQTVKNVLKKAPIRILSDFTMPHKQVTLKAGAHVCVQMICIWRVLEYRLIVDEKEHRSLEYFSQ